MPMAFPPIRPSQRTYKAGRFPEERFQAQNGVVTRIRYGARRVESELALVFENIRDFRAAEILELWRNSQSANDWIVFAVENVTAGLASELVPWISEETSGIRWRFAESPEVESVRPGRSTLRCRFIGDRDGD